LLQSVSIVFFFAVGLLPPMGYFGSFQDYTTIDEYVKYWRIRIISNFFNNLVTCIACIFMTVPIYTYNPAYYVLSEQTETTYYWLPIIMFAFTLLMYLLIIVYYILWFLRTVEERQKTIEEIYVDRVRNDKLTVQEQQDLADLQALAWSMGKRGGKAGKSRPGTSKASSRASTPSQASRTTTPTRERSEQHVPREARSEQHVPREARSEAPKRFQGEPHKQGGGSNETFKSNAHHEQGAKPKTRSSFPSHHHQEHAKPTSRSTTPARSRSPPSRQPPPRARRQPER